jgi:hypothetical protein
MRLLLLLAPCLLLAAPLLPAGAEDEPEAPLSGEALREQVRRWIADLRSDEFTVREAAREGLKSHGSRARDLLEAAQDDEDPEVRRTVRALLGDTHGKPIRSATKARDRKIDRMGLVTLALKDAPLADALAKLGGQIGARFELPDDAKPRRVSLELRETPCFVALRALLEAGGLRMPRTFDATGTATLDLADGEPVPPWAAVGPVLVEVVEVTATRALDAVKPRRYALKLRVQWAPAFHVSQYEMPRVEIARDERGVVLKATGSSRSVRYGVGQYTRSATVQVHLEPTGTEVPETLAILDVVLPIASLQHGQAKVAVQDTARLPVCLGPDGKEAEPGTNEAVRFHSLEKSDDGRSQWVADISATLLDTVAQRTVQVFGTSAEERLDRLQIYGGRSRSADGTVRLTARNWRSGAEKPEGLVVTWFRREDTGDLKFRLKDIPLR